MNTFEYPEDRDYFANLLTGGDVARLEKEFADLFDFEHWAMKRWKFEKIKRKVLKELLEKYGEECQLKIHPDCSVEKIWEPDHIIPLSSNVLNKKLRGLDTEPGKKVLSQSFGSNNPRNLTLSCKRCNRFKKHNFLDSEVVLRLIK